jgi:hypothetical protein
MKHARMLMLFFVLIVFSGLIVYFGCGDYNEPEGASEVERTGFIIFTEEQQIYNGDSSFDVCVLGSGTVQSQEWKEDKEIWADFTFKFIPNPDYECDCVPSYAIVDECALSIPFFDYYEEKHTCGPWKVDLSAGGESELTVITHVWGLGWLAHYIVNMGGSNGDPLSYTAYMKIWAKSIDGTEQEAETYALISVFPEPDAMKEGLLVPSWITTYPPCP